MTIYWKQRGAHIHVRWFSEGVLKGTVIFNKQEWETFKAALENSDGFGYRIPIQEEQ